MKIWAWAASVGAVVAAAACGSSTGSTTSATNGTGGSGTTSTTTTGSMTTTTTTATTATTGTGIGGSTGCGSFTISMDATCEMCAETNCCSELSACDTGTPCNDLDNCLTGCMAGDTACQMTCGMMNQAGVSDFNALVSCVFGMNMMGGACNMECSSGQICDSGLQDSNNKACGDCEGTNCCMEFDACAKETTGTGGNPACLDCLTKQGTMGCDANPLYMAVNTCRMSKCSDSCGADICDSGLSTGNGKCDTCLGTNCCMQIDACKGDTTCFNNCLMTNMPAASCSTDTLYQAVKTCWNTNCAGMTACGGML